MSAKHNADSTQGRVRSCNLKRAFSSGLFNLREITTRHKSPREMVFLSECGTSAITYAVDCRRIGKEIDEHLSGQRYVTSLVSTVPVGCDFHPRAS